MKCVAVVLVALLSLLLFANPAAAAEFQKTAMEASFLDGVKNWASENKYALMGAGMIVVGTVLVLTGAGAGAGAALIVAGSGLVVANEAYKDYKSSHDSSDDSSANVFTQSYNLSETPETSVLSSYSPVNTTTLDQVAQSDINNLIASLSPSQATYELIRQGDNQFQNAVLIGPDKLYGPVVFPVSFIFQAAGNTEVKQTNYLTSIEFLVIDAQGNTVDKVVITQTFSATPGQILTFSEILKAPDAYSSEIEAMLNGQVNASFLSQLKQSPAIQPYHVEIRVWGYAENYYWDDSQSTWVKDTDQPFSITWIADKMDQYEQAGQYVFSGLSVPLPPALQGNPSAYSFYPYQVFEYGALQNAVIRYWGQGLALYNQNYAYRAYIQANSNMWAGFSGVTVSDEWRVIVLRVYTNSSVEIAAIQPLSSTGNLGDLLAYAKKIEGNVYLQSNSDDTGIANYEFYVVVLGHVVYNSTTKTFWVLVSPALVVQEGNIITWSQTFSQIAPLVSDGKIDSSERSVINASIDALISQEEQKIAAASAILEQASRYSNSSAVYYAQNAIAYYSSAIQVLNEAKAGDAKVVQNNLVRARLYDEAGDMALKAAKLALAGDYEGAQNAFEQAQNLAGQGDATSPIATIPGSVQGIWAWIKAHWWIIVLIIAALIILKIVLGVVL